MARRNESPSKRRSNDGSESPTKRRSGVGGFFPWVSTMLSDNCSTRLQEIVGFQRPAATRRRPLTGANQAVPFDPNRRMLSPSKQRRVPSSIEDTANPRIRATPSGDLPVDFFPEIARKAVKDPFIEAQLDQDLAAPILWAKPKSLRLLFMQMCIRDRHDLCRDVWWQLEEVDRRTYRDVYHGFVPPNFFEIVASDTDDMYLYDDVSENFSMTREGTLEPAQSKECSWASHGLSSREGSWAAKSREGTLERLTHVAGTLGRLQSVPRPLANGCTGGRSNPTMCREWTGRSNLDLDRERTDLSEW